MVKIFSSLGLLATFLVGLSAQAASGVFMIVKGDVKVTSKGKVSPAKVGVKVNEGDIVVTGPDSRAKIVMMDKNVLNLSPDSTLEIVVYKNDPKTQSKKVELKVDQGKVRASVEQKYDEDKNTFKIKTPTAVAGVRGTDFSVSFNPATKKSQVVTFKGAVAVALPNLSNNGGLQKAVLVRAGESTDVGADSNIPTAPQQLPKQELEKMDIESDATKAPDIASNASPPTAVGSGNSDADTTTQPQGEPQAQPSRSETQSSNAPPAQGEQKREPAAAPGPGSKSMISSSDLAPESATQLVDSASNRLPPAATRPAAPIVTGATQQATQNLITETVRNQITNGRTRVKIEINR